MTRGLLVGAIDAAGTANDATFTLDALGRFRTRVLPSGSGLGAFTQLDTVTGSAQNPASMNRFLYAEANPATMTDPDGHCAYGSAAQQGDVFAFLSDAVGCGLGTVAGAGMAVWDTGVGIGQMAVCIQWAPCTADRMREAVETGTSIRQALDEKHFEGVAKDVIDDLGRRADKWVKDSQKPGFEGTFNVSYTGTNIAIAVAGTKGLGALCGARLATAAGEGAGAAPGAIAGFADIPLVPIFRRKNLIRIDESYVPPSVSGVPGGVLRNAISIGTATGYRGRGWRFPFHAHTYLDRKTNLFKPWTWVTRIGYGAKKD